MMDARVAAVAAILLLAALGSPSIAAPGPNARPPLATAAPVLAVAMADDGTLLATTQDPGSRLPTTTSPTGTPAVHTWYLWRPDGSLIASGSADLPTCESRLQDLCQSPVVAAAIAPAGGRFAVLSDVAQSVADGSDAMLGVGAAGALATTQPLSGGTTQATLRPVAVAMDHDGESVAVLEFVTPFGGAGTARVEWFDVGATLALTPVMAAYPMGGPATALALSDDGERLVVASDKVYRFTHSTNPPVPLGSGPPTAIAIAGAGLHGVLWGMAGGTVHYAIDGSAIPRFSDALGSADVTAVAVSRDGDWGAVGDQAGRVRVLALNETGSPAVRATGDFAMPDAVAQVSMSPDGQFLLARSQTQVRLYHNGAAVGGNATTNLTRLWTDVPAGRPNATALSATGHLAAAAVGSGVVEYVESHGIRADPAEAVITAGQARTLDVTYRNHGNRPENATVEAWFPATWFVEVTPSQFEVPVEGNVSLQVRIVLPAREAPGTYHVFLNHTLAGNGLTGTSSIRVTVPEKDLMVLDPLGPTSLGIRAKETVHFTAQVENRGNRLGIGELRMEVEPASWRATLSQDSFTLEPGARANATVTLTAPDVVEDGETGRVRLVLVGREHEPVMLYATVGAKFEVTLVSSPEAFIAPGNTTSIELRLQNKGNVPDSYGLSLGGLPEGWHASFLPGNETVRDVPAGEFRLSTVEVTAPVDAEPGLRVFLDVTATSQGNPTKSAQREIRIAVSDPDGGIPAGDGINWLAVGVVGLAVLVIGGFVGGILLLRRK